MANRQHPVSSLRRYLRMAQHYDIDCRQVLAQAGIDSDILDSPPGRLSANSSITSQQMEQFLRILIDASGDPLFGLHTARLVQPDTFDILGYIALNSQTLREALSLFPLYENSLIGMGKTTVAHEGGLVRIGWECYSTNSVIRHQMTDNVLASWVAYTHDVICLDSKPVKITFTHAAPEKPEHLAVYQQVFDCDVLFGQPYNASWITEQQLDLPLPQANSELLQTLLDHAAQRAQSVAQSVSITQQVKSLIRLLLSESIPSREKVAAQLNMSGRTMQRHLASEQTNYKDLLKEVRLEMATHLLQNTGLSIDEIATRLGFAETRSFHRSFKQWTGSTVSAFRIGER